MTLITIEQSRFSKLRQRERWFKFDRTIRLVFFLLRFDGEPREVLSSRQVFFKPQAKRYQEECFKIQPLRSTHPTRCEEVRRVPIPLDFDNLITFTHRRPSEAALNKFLLSTLKDENNPITHSTSGLRAGRSRRYWGFQKRR